MDSTNVRIKTSVDSLPNAPHGRNIHFGVREHAMGAIVYGMAAYGGVIPFGSTFLIFSDYPSRLQFPYLMKFVLA